MKTRQKKNKKSNIKQIIRGRKEDERGPLCQKWRLILERLIRKQPDFYLT